MAGERLVSLIQKSAKEASNSTRTTDLMYGEILSLSPLKIMVDSRFTITEEFVILSSLCQEKKDTIGTEEVVLWRGLLVGDKVQMLRVRNGNQFYILEREGGLSV